MHALLARSLEFHSRFPTAGSLMLVKHRDDDGQGLATNEVRGIRKAMKQRTADTASDFGKLIRERTNPIDIP